MRGECVEPHVDAHARLRTRRCQRHVLGHPAIDLAVAVEVAGRDEYGAGGLGRVQEGRCQGRPVLDPAVVGRVGAVVDSSGTDRELGEASGVGGIGGDALDTWQVGAGARPGHKPDVVPHGSEASHDGRADRAGADDEVGTRRHGISSGPPSRREHCSQFGSLLSKLSRAVLSLVDTALDAGTMTP